MKYIIIGLGNYGTALAEELSGLGHEVVAVDEDMTKVEAIKDKLAGAFQLDATDRSALRVLPLRDVDIVIVAIGENFGASIKVTALLKLLKVKHIYARANDEVHRSILQAFNIDHILSPERDAAVDLVRKLEFGYNVEVFEIDKSHGVFKYDVSNHLVGYLINDLKLKEKFNLKLLALRRGNTLINALRVAYDEKEVLNEVKADDRIVEGDQLVIYGRYRDFHDFIKAM